MMLGVASAFGARRRKGSQARKPEPPAVTIVRASHNLTGYAPEAMLDDQERTYWLVPGGQRMELMSRDKFVVLDLARPCHVDAISLRGVVSSLGKARVLVDCSQSPHGPWQRIGLIRGLASASVEERHSLHVQRTPSRYVRLYIRREGHATFRHEIHRCRLHARPANDLAPEAG